jgi:hypothetical protein
MQDAQNNATSNEYRSVPISILVESATNPRKRFDEKNFAEPPLQVGPSDSASGDNRTDSTQQQFA